VSIFNEYTRIVGVALQLFSAGRAELAGVEKNFSIGLLIERRASLSQAYCCADVSKNMFGETIFPQDYRLENR